MPAAAPPAKPPAAARPQGLRLESSAFGGPSPTPASTPAPPAAVPGSRAAQPAPPAPGVRVQPVPKGAACAVPPERGIERERDWVRKTFRAQYDAAAGTVARVMSEVPGLRSATRGSAADALTDLVAVRLYLTGNSAEVDDAVRSARVGPHVPLARCVASGLRRLPSYRGAAVLPAELSDAERAWYRDGRLVTEWAFCSALALPSDEAARRPRFVIWSMTARRTGLLDATAPDRVMFLPGTTFKVLRPADGPDDPVLIRELSPTEVGPDGRVEPGRAALDDLALESLERAAAALPNEGSPAGPAQDPRTPPGLLTAVRGSRTTATPAPPSGATHEGAKL